MTSNYIRWYKHELPLLHKKFKFVESSKYLNLFQGFFPKIGSNIEIEILENIFKHKNIGNFILQKSSKEYRQKSERYKQNKIYYRSKGGLYYKVFTNFTVNSSNEIDIYTIRTEYIYPILAILNSNFYFWFYDVFSSNRVLTFDNISSFPFDLNNASNDVISKLTHFGEELMEDYKRNASVQIRNYSGFGAVECYTIYARKSKALMDQIDKVLGSYYELETSFVEFISNYEIQYRTDD